MLEYIRDRSHGLIVWTIIVMIVLAFALFGLSSYFGSDPNVYVAEINDEKITANEFQSVYQNERAFRASMMGENFNPSLLDEDEIKRDALDRLLNTKVIAMTAKDEGFRISDRQLSQQIHQRQEFQSDGKFDVELYKRLLNARGFSPRNFEASMYQDLVASQMISGILDTAFATDYELNSIYRMQNQQRDFSYLILNRGEIQQQGTEITDEEIARFYESNLERFAVPEKVSIEYLELSTQNFFSEISLDDESLHKLYEERAGDFMTEEQRRARHILINAEQDADEEVVTAARNKAQQLLERIKAGESFETVAKDNSDDGGSAPDGGDLGFFGKGAMVKPFEDAVFSMSVGDISEPVQSSFGFHIIQLTDIKPGQIKPFEELRDRLEQEYREQKAEEQFFEQVDMVSNLTYENPDSLVVAGEELKLPIKTTEAFERDSGQGVAANPAVREAAFSADVLQAGNNSELIEIGQNHVLVLRVKKHQPPQHRPLNDVKHDIMIQISTETANEKVKELGQSLLQKLAEGQDAEALAKEHKTEWKKTGLIGRTDTSVNREITQQAFRMKRPADGESARDGVSLLSGDYALIELHAVSDGDFATIDDAARESLGAELERSYGRQESNNFMEGLKTRIKITEYPDNI